MKIPKGYFKLKKGMVLRVGDKFPFRPNPTRLSSYFETAWPGKTVGSAMGNATYYIRRKPTTK